MSKLTEAEKRTLLDVADKMVRRERANANLGRECDLDGRRAGGTDGLRDANYLADLIRKAVEQ